MAGADETLAGELRGYLARHDERWGARAEHLSVHVDYGDLSDWAERIAALEAAIARHIESAARDDYTVMCGPTSDRCGPDWAVLPEMEREYWREAVRADFSRGDAALPAAPDATGPGAGR